MCALSDDKPTRYFFVKQLIIQASEGEQGVIVACRKYIKASNNVLFYGCCALSTQENSDVAVVRFTASTPKHSSLLAKYLNSQRAVRR